MFYGSLSQKGSRPLFQRITVSVCRAYKRGVQKVCHTQAQEDESMHLEFFCKQAQNY